MALENAPWAVDGAKHSAAVARTLAYASTSGAEGIVEPADLRVRATQTPSGSVRVAPGGIAILNRAPNGGQQTYTARNVSETLVEVQPTGSGGGRVDYVWAHIIDPEYGGQFPENPQTAQYFFLTASAAQPEGNGWYRLARIDIPASTATITQAMITDLRELANPRREEHAFGRPRIHEDDDAVENYLTRRADVGGEYFPGGSGYANSATFSIPDWVTHMMIEADWMSLRVVGGKNSWGTFWIEYGDEYRERTWPNSQNYEFATQRFFWDTVGAGSNYTTNWRLITQSLRVPAKLRGKRVTFVFKAGVSPAAPEVDAVFMDALGGLGLKLTFSQEPIGPEAY